MKFATGLSLILLGASALSFPSAQAAQNIKICGDEAGWPPFTYVDPKEQGQIRGASVDVITEILRRAGYETKVELMPWKRCLHEVENGASAIVLDASYSEERARTYLISKPYYSVNSALFYMAKKFPSPPSIKTQEDMKKYKYCGLFGYNYSMYALPDSALDTSAKDEAGRFSMMRNNRCDFALGDVEPLKNFAALGQVDLSGTAYIPIPGAKPKDFHALITRTPAGGERLLKVIDDGIKTPKADKTYVKIFKRYGI